MALKIAANRGDLAFGVWSTILQLHQGVQCAPSPNRSTKSKSHTGILRWAQRADCKRTIP